MLDVYNLRVITAIWPFNVIVVAIHIEVDILVGPCLIIRYTKLNLRAIRTIIAQWEYHDVEPLARATSA